MNIIKSNGFKYLFVLSVAINLIAVVFAVRRLYYTGSTTSLYNSPVSYYEVKKKLQAYLPIHKNDIVFIGDSQVERFELNEYFPGLPIKNRGIAGDIVSNVYNRIDDILKGRPAKIFIEVGTNDIYTKTPLDTSMLYFKRIISNVRNISPDTKLFIQSVLPRELFFKEQVLDLNSELKQLCEKNKITYINLYSNYSDNGIIKSGLDCGDQLHLSGAGYKEWAKILNPYL